MIAGIAGDEGKPRFRPIIATALDGVSLSVLVRLEERYPAHLRCLTEPLEKIWHQVAPGRLSDNAGCHISDGRQHLGSPGQLRDQLGGVIINGTSDVKH